MIPEYKSKTNVYVGLGLLIALIGACLGAGGALLMLVGHGVFVVGCCFYAKAKGYCEMVGILGVFSLLGLIVLVCLTDKEREPRQRQGS